MSTENENGSEVIKSKSDRYFTLGDDTIEKFNLAQKKLALPVKIAFKLEGDKKQKSLVCVKKISELYYHSFGYQVMVIINEGLLDNLDDDESVDILFREALNGLTVNPVSGAIKISSPDYITSSAMMEKYKEELPRAKEMEKMALAQMADKKETEGIETF